MTFELGRVCVKLAGRDAGKTCVVIDTLDNGFVLIDGETRRRKCNTLHLEPTQHTLNVSAKASHEDVMKALGLEPKKTVKKKAGARPRTLRKSKAPSATPAKTTAAKPAAKTTKPAVKAAAK